MLKNSASGIAQQDPCRAYSASKVPIDLKLSGPFSIETQPTISEHKNAKDNKTICWDLKEKPEKIKTTNSESRLNFPKANIEPSKKLIGNKKVSCGTDSKKIKSNKYAEEKTLELISCNKLEN